MVPNPKTPESKRLGTVRIGLALASIVFALAVGVVAVLDSVAVMAAGPAHPVVWWIAYAAFGVIVLAIQGYLPSPPWTPRSGLIGSLIALSILLVLLFATEGAAALLFVLTATMASFFWPWRAVSAVIAGQTCVIGIAGLLAGWPVADLVVNVTVFGISQIFGALVVYTARSEAEAREDLAVAHAELRSTAALLEVSTREAERLRIARDLHDVAGHQLTALSLELEVASHLTDRAAQDDRILRARAIANDLMATVRNAVTQMRATPSDLASALGELASGAPGLDVSVKVEGETHLTPRQTAVIVWCVQESITNTLRHAHAQSLQIRVVVTMREARVDILDDGEGTTRVSPGHGLTGMRERVELAGGMLMVESAPRAGFTITALIPREAPRLRDA
ncbi:sensor histidine kinase [Microbacterium sp. HD4P20]|uniref:sensor histidine kinase n=1 Tax=Microbacterium sp. HD4P20 TaxID=2864874 RepID=UPI0020A403AD|nr:sensor histidine kinase [Microbacterium sp. HD4P20]MCP2635350.1 sensor histidine kinase [Microbacterium sp. HD4P20]